MTKFTTKSGIEAMIQPSSIRNALKLKNSISKALIKQNIDISKINISNIKDVKNIKDLTNLDIKSIMPLINSLIKIILIVDSDVDVLNSIFLCLERCLYNKEKITIDTFEDFKARADYYEILIKCLKENLMPFIMPLFSNSKSKNQKKKENILE